MTTLFQCPECHAVFAEPVSAAFVLAVRCADCDLADQVWVGRSPSHALPVAA